VVSVIGMTQQAFRRGGSVLPGDVTTFVGRRRATAEVKRLLADSRLVTLTGFGGVGKSRLALHVARQLRRSFAGGVWLVELAGIRDPLLVGQAIAATLGVRDTDAAREPEAVLADYLADKQVLLVLDNCEHVVDACRQLVESLLSAAPGVHVLATSREVFGILAEHVWTVPPLSVPSVEDPDLPEQRLDGTQPCRQYESMMLFEERAAAVLPGFALSDDNEAVVARLCQRLDGLPLAIELAAARARTLSIEQILERMEDHDRVLATSGHSAQPRHQTLHAAVQWSYDLCSELERTLWATCSVFAGEFDLEAAEQICAINGLTADDVFAGVAGLVDKSILVRGAGGPGARYQMLEVIRQYGHDRLVERGDQSAVGRRHRDYYLRLAEKGDAEWFGPRQPEWVDRFRVERRNLWAALDSSLNEVGESRTGLRVVAAMGWYWTGSGVLRSGRYWVDRALALDTEPSHERARALWLAGMIAIAQGDMPYAFSALEECCDLARRLGDRSALAYGTQFLGRAKILRNDLSDALTLLDQAQAAHRALGELNSVTTLGLYHCGMAASLVGDVERAVGYFDECIATCEVYGERWSRSWALWGLAYTWLGQGDLRQARVRVMESLRLKRALNDQFGIPFCVELLAWLAGLEGAAERAAVLLGIASRMWEPIGTSLLGWEVLQDWNRRCTARSCEALRRQAFEANFQKGRQFTFDAAATFALGEEPTTPTRSPTHPRTSTTMLTKREREVANLVAQGMGNKQIATQLVISQRTAEAHVENILTKLGFTSRTQIAVWATENRQKSQADDT
jgi:predicted ATPase/DNA-binding CsgD family transcriptional regulator